MDTARTAEFTTVILTSAFPTMPRLLQWLRSRNDAASQPRSYQQPSKPMYLDYNTRSNAEAGASWNGSGSKAAMFSDNYILLEERARADGEDPAFQSRRDRPEGAGPAPLVYSSDPRVQDNHSVRKTVRMETSYSTQDEIRPRIR